MLVRSVAPFLGVALAIAAACGGGGPANQAQVIAHGGAGDDAGALPEVGGPDATNPQCPSGQPAPYPSDTSIAVSSAIPDLGFDGIDSSGSAAKIVLHDYFEPCAARSRLLVIRVSAGWCGTCRWHVGHTKELRQLDIGARLEFLDVLVADDDNMPPGVDSLASWRGRIDAPEELAIDPGFAFKVLNKARTPLPLLRRRATRLTPKRRQSWKITPACLNF